jgi:UDP-3-O-[3-hydroxymyristoyl] glucosamine N-acyltransferase
MNLEELAKLLETEVPKESADLEIHGVAAVGEAEQGEITFLGNPKYLPALRLSRASAALVPFDFADSVPPILLRVKNPMAAFGMVIDLFSDADHVHSPGIHPLAYVAPDARIADSASIQPFAVVETGAVIGAGTVVGAHCYVGPETSVGENSILYPHVSIMARCLVGNRVILHSGVVLGSDGFGFECVRGQHVKLPQRGIVQVDDDVEIGANTTVDRARFGRTWIQKGTKIDNLVQIGHNVTIGEHSILCGQVGIAGSTKLGRLVTLAGQVGINGHIEIGDEAIITAKAGVVKSVAPKEIMVGLPARPMKAYKRMLFNVERLEKLYVRVKELEKQLAKCCTQQHE